MLVFKSILILCQRLEGNLLKSVAYFNFAVGMTISETL